MKLKYSLNNLPHDKALHVIVGVIVYTMFNFISPMVAIGMVVVAGIGKEIYDGMNKDKHTVDVWDAVATFAGGLLGYLCYLGS